MDIYLYMQIFITIDISKYCNYFTRFIRKTKEL